MPTAGFFGIRRVTASRRPPKKQSYAPMPQITRLTGLPDFYLVRNSIFKEYKKHNPLCQGNIDFILLFSHTTGTFPQQAVFVDIRSTSLYIRKRIFQVNPNHSASTNYEKIIIQNSFNNILTDSDFCFTYFLPSGIAIYFRLFLIIVILIESLVLFKIICIDNRANKFTSNISTALLSFFFIFLLLEITFMFIPRTNFFDFSLSSRLWYAKYDKPLNSLGYRDNEPRNSRHVILFVGDSFTAGRGLKSIDERYSNIVGKELNKISDKYTVINIGKSGVDSLGEYNLMKQFSHMTKIKPEIIVLQYYGNDIEYVASEYGTKFEGFKTYKDVRHIFKPLIAGSYLLNYLYWSFPREHLSISYINFLDRSYKNKLILTKHKDELKLFIDYARDNSAQLIVIVFPFLNDVEMSDTMYVNEIADYFRDNKIRVINVSPLVRDIPVADRIVNKNDGHPSIKVNKIVALEILKYIHQ